MLRFSKNQNRCAILLWGVLFTGLCANATIFGGEQIPSISEPLSPASFSESLLFPIGHRSDWMRKVTDYFSKQVEFPRTSQITHSRQPVQQITLLGEDRFIGECLEWGTETAIFRLQNGQSIRVPILAMTRLEPPPGEQLKIDESFDSNSIRDTASKPGESSEDNKEFDVSHSLLVDASSAGSRHELDQSLNSARIEFAFRVIVRNLKHPCGEWHLEFEGDQGSASSTIVRIGGARLISASSETAITDATFQSWHISEGWHSFVAVITPERTWLMIDETMLGSFVMPKTSFRAIRFHPTQEPSQNAIQYDDLFIAKLNPINNDLTLIDEVENDRIRMDSGDELFGRLEGLSRKSVFIEALGERQRVPWTPISGLDWKMPLHAVQQSLQPLTGIVATMEMQPFTDRPWCRPDRWTLTILRVDSSKLIVQHSLVGEFTIRWHEIRRIIPHFSGRTWLVDARRFHLGNSIRTDFQRYLPDGIELIENITLKELPIGQPYFSLNVSEMEAAAPDAPLASPFLTELRSGRLVTDVYVNDQRIGNLNSQIRFKTKSRNPNRIGLLISHGILKVGENSIRLQQKPLQQTGREFDDCEISNMRLDFKMNE